MSSMRYNFFLYHYRSRLGVLSGLRKMVSAMGPNEDVSENHESTEGSSVPCLNKSAKKRKILEPQPFSAKKK